MRIVNSVATVVAALALFGFSGTAGAQAPSPDGQAMPDLSRAADGFITGPDTSGRLAGLQKKWFGFAMKLPE